MPWCLLGTTPRDGRAEAAAAPCDGPLREDIHITWTYHRGVPLVSLKESCIRRTALASNAATIDLKRGIIDLE